MFFKNCICWFRVFTWQLTFLKDLKLKIYTGQCRTGLHLNAFIECRFVKHYNQNSLSGKHEIICWITQIVDVGNSCFLELRYIEKEDFCS